MIILGGISLGENFYLKGIESASLVALEQKRTISGSSVVTVTPTPGGRSLTLSTQDSSGATIGIWCRISILNVKDLEATGLPVVLDYHGDMYNVIIAGTSYEPLFKWEKESPTKAFTGKISLIEV